MAKKLNRNYFSFFDFLLLPFTNVTADKQYPPGYGYRYNDGVEDKPEPIPKTVGPLARNPEPEIMFYYWNQWRGMAQPIFKLKKDCADFIQPYYTHRKLFKDLFQPFIGILNCLKGLLSLLGGIATTALGLVISPCFVLAPHGLLNTLIYATSWIIRGIFDLVRGISQIVMTPLTWLLKIPTRALITHDREKHGQVVTVEEKPEIKRLTTRAMRYLNEIKNKENHLKKMQALEPAKKEIKKTEYEKKREELKTLEASGLGTNNPEISRLRVQANLASIWVWDSSDELRKARKDCTETLLIVVRILYEINRKLTKSLNNGWATKLGHTGEDVKKQFNDCYSIFWNMWEDFCNQGEPSEVSAKPTHNSRNVVERHDMGINIVERHDMRIDDNFIEKTREFLCNFST